jgi:hypothetical protein
LCSERIAVQKQSRFYRESGIRAQAGCRMLRHQWHFGMGGGFIKAPADAAARQMYWLLYF